MVVVGKNFSSYPSIINEASVEASTTQNGRSWQIIPSSHDKAAVRAGGALSLCVVLLVLGIIFWAVGASQGNPSMVLAGKVMFGLSFVPAGIVALVLCCISSCGCCFLAASVASR